jgi:ATP-binding cassette subfamily B protein RaxB
MVRFKSMASATLQRSRLDSLRGALLQLIQYADTIVITWLAATLMLEGKISVGVFYSFLLYKALFSSHLAEAINAVFQFFMLSIPTARVDDILDAKEEHYMPLADINRAVEVRDFESIEMRDVGFNYGISDLPVLRNVHLDVRKGDKIAIVGPSGSGKSTLFKLLTATEPIQTGHVALNGIAWPNLAVDEIRRHSANMRQGDIILHGSIADNVSLFAANTDDDKVHKVLEQVGLLQDVMRLPMRTRTIISDSIANISAGQRQRLLLARALYQDRELYLLDEPTSNLDPDSVRHIADLLQTLDRTLVTITHDMALAATFPVRYRLVDGGLVRI